MLLNKIATEDQEYFVPHKSVGPGKVPHALFAGNISLSMYCTKMTLCFEYDQRWVCI